MFLLYHPNSCKSKKMKTENNHLRSVLNLPFLILNCLLYFLLIPQPVFGQGDMGARQSFAQAESEYQIGRIDNAITIVNANVSRYDGTLKSGAYRLLALCYLAQDNIEEANRYVDLLLQEDPYYSITVNDPERFAELIRDKKEGKTTIVTASQQSETLEEAPVPVTLITEEMIKAIGARTLKDVLLAYVPGITSVESPNEVNVAMHGVYSAGQEKILIMINGQRMNARATNKAAPDYSISLNKIKQIEVLRGPASSLYGNVALMAVVNIITKSGSEINGIKVSAGVGNFKTGQGNLLFGKHFMNVDFMGWAAFYSSQGEKVFIPQKQAIGENPHNSYARIDAFNHLPSYDYGFIINWENFSLNFNRRYGKKVPPFADIHTSMGSPYNYDNYKHFNGESVGHGMTFTHAGIRYNKQLGKFYIDINAYFDLNKSNLYSIPGDSIYAPMDDTGHYGFFQVINWSEYALGGIATINYSYPDLGILGKGNLLFGIQTEYMNLYGSEGFVGENFNQVFKYWPVNPIAIGHEISYSPFIQIKHTFNKNWILNVGGREDLKKRKNGKLYSSFSPRISLIYLMNKYLTLKTSYSRSFVDAPYFYRYNESPSYKGPEDLRPEYMNAVQFSFNYKPNSRFLWDGVFFYNNLTNFIFRDTNLSSDDYPYMNAGELQTFGIENTLQYITPRFFANFNITWQTVLDGKNYMFRGHQNYNIPNWFANLTLQGNLFKQKEHAVWLYGSGRLIGKQLSPIDNIVIGGINRTDHEYTLPTEFILNAGIRYQYKRIETQLAFYNLFDNEYYQGGSTPIPYIQQGFSLLLSLSYTLK